MITRPRVAAARLALGAVLVGALVAGCGGSDSSMPPSGGVGALDVGAPISLADCTDWKQATVDQRLGTVAQLKDFAGGPVGSGAAGAPTSSGAVLEDKQAYDLLDGYCSQSFARGFKLYKLYERAAAFAGVHPDQ